MAVGDNNYTSYYVYDNGGERTYKLTGKNELMNINGNWMNFAYMDNPTLYTSAYLVAGVQGYTKHYYAGSERVSSAIGLGGLEIIDHPLHLRSSENWDEKSGSLKNLMRKAVYDCLGHDYNNKKNLQGLYQMTHAASGTMSRYFYHPDHIGSSSWITDGTGQAIQHLHYLPFGEDWVDQRNSSWNAPYTFSGKEKDVETGYGYFGARYYDSGLSIWLSVDPMSDKYPSMSPYNYCANNPVILVDPDGREIDWHPDGFGNLVADKGDNYETLCNYLSTIYGDIKNVPSGEMLGYKLQLAAFEGADITGLKLTSNNGTFDNLVGKFLVTKFNQDENWGVDGACSPTTFNRVKLASEFVYGKDLLGDNGFNNPIYASWNGHPRKGIPIWGSPIVSFLGLGMTVEEQNFQNGLTPGAILGFQSNFQRGGHSSIFIGYKEDGSGLIEWGHTGIFWRDFNDNSYYSKSLVRATNFK
jgi:RHS repeat-associated protein